MCCLNVWPSASLQLYIVAHCDKQLHAPGSKDHEWQEWIPMVNQPVCSTFCAKFTAKDCESTTRDNFSSERQGVAEKLFLTFGEWRYSR